MRADIKNQVTFLGRSMIWSSLLFVMLMLIINLDDVKRKLTGNYVTITRNNDTVMQKVTPVTVSEKVTAPKPKV